jgi:microsomal dipeptidase-like Zn-dependent dipeptidase
MSIWEKSDLVVDGHTVVAGTPQGEKEIMARMDAALARLTAGGARVVMVTEAAPAPNPAQGTQTTSLEADNDGYARLNALLRRFQARHRDQVTLVDLHRELHIAVQRAGRYAFQDRLQAPEIIDRGHLRACILQGCRHGSHPLSSSCHHYLRAHGLSPLGRC